MFANVIAVIANRVFGSPELGMELSAATLLGLGVALYVARVAWIALADVRRMELKAVHAAGPAPSQYRGSSTAG